VCNILYFIYFYKFFIVENSELIILRESKLISIGFIYLKQEKQKQEKHIEIEGNCVVKNVLPGRSQILMYPMEDWSSQKSQKMITLQIKKSLLLE